MGHNLGMLHDFDEDHGGEDGECNGQGIMSYGDVPQQWSSCSAADYLARYNQVGGDSWCMDAAPTACGGTDTGTTTTTTSDDTGETTTVEPTTTTEEPTTTTEAEGCAYESWQGDGFCDDENNVASCDYDGGDCCGRRVRKNYCTVCACLEP